MWLIVAAPVLPVVAEQHSRVVLGAGGDQERERQVAGDGLLLVVRCHHPRARRALAGPMDKTFLVGVVETDGEHVAIAIRVGARRFVLLVLRDVRGAPARRER